MEWILFHEKKQLEIWWFEYSGWYQQDQHRPYFGRLPMWFDDVGIWDKFNNTLRFDSFNIRYEFNSTSTTHILVAPMWFDGLNIWDEFKKQPEIWWF